MLNKLLIIGITLITMGCNTSKITFIVETQSDTDQVTIAGNHYKLGDWDPSKVTLKKEDNNLFSITFELPKNTKIEYKFTKGSWDFQALNNDGSIPTNHTLFVNNDTTIIYTINQWGEINTISTITGNVIYHNDFYSPELDNYRDIIIWLPPSYSNNIEKHYPVLYLHDGQNLFNPATSFLGIDWQLDETVTNLISNDNMKEIIMVGIYNTDDRKSEYSPMHNGQKYSKFLIETVKPFIDLNYRTLKDAENTAIMGSSMGGIISFHLAWEYPQVFSMAGCLSPAFLVDRNEIVNRVRKTKETKPIKIVIMNGTIGLEAELQPAITEMISVLNDKNFENLIYKISEGSEHNEAAWAEQVTIPLLYFFGL